MNKKIIFSVIIVTLLIILMTQASYATIDVSKLQGVSNPTGVSKFTTLAGQIIGVILTVAVAISVAMVIIIGIKYIIASPDQKAEYKGRLITFTIGAALIFGASGILKFIQTMAGWFS